MRRTAKAAPGDLSWAWPWRPRFTVISAGLLGEVEKLAVQVGEDLVLALIQPLLRKDALGAADAARIILETDAGIAALHAARGKAR